MASLGHVVVGLAAARWHVHGTATPRSSFVATALGFVALSLLPDADVIAFSLGIPYAHPLGHRGASHSLAFAVVVAALTAMSTRAYWTDRARLAALVAAVVASHGLLDALTDGGLGAALLWPISTERFFAPWRPLPVAPIGTDFISRRGLHCALVELLLFAPLLVYALAPRRRIRLPSD